MSASSSPLWMLAEPILKSDAFRRLDKISFLGILSPRYAALSSPQLASVGSDSSRAAHSISVAKSIYEISRHLGLPKDVRAYGVAWALIHDIATWPLSHTGESGFVRATNVSSQRLREMMLFGSDRISSRFSLYSTVKSQGLDVEILSALFKKGQSDLDGSLGVLHKIIHSQLTPDTLEGIYRTGLVCGIRVPRPSAFWKIMARDLLDDIWIEPKHSAVVLEFWRAKGLVYSSFINRPEAVEFESRWSRAIGDRFSTFSLTDTLTITEQEVVNSICMIELPRIFDIDKYKAPLRYEIEASYREEKRLSASFSIDDFAGILLKTRDDQYGLSM